MPVVAMLNEARKSKDLLIAQVAKLAGFSTSFTGDVFSGYRPVSLEFGCRVCPLLGLDVLDVLTDQASDQIAARGVRLAAEKAEKSDVSASPRAA